jgi:hypothetical protein
MTVTNKLQTMHHPDVCRESGGNHDSPQDSRNPGLYKVQLKCANKLSARVPHNKTRGKSVHIVACNTVATHRSRDGRMHQTRFCATTG